MLRYEIQLWLMPRGYAVYTGQVWIDSYTIWYLLAKIPAIIYELRGFFLGGKGLPENEIFIFF